MRTTFTILLSGLLLCACSPKETTSVEPAIDLVEAGKDVSWENGSVLHVTKREGNSLGGIQLTRTNSDGTKHSVTAVTGKISPGSLNDTTDANSVIVTLYEAKGQDGSTFEEMTFPLRRQP